ncbi:alpha/beta-Hydrolases superfamily protein isoform X2 [Wolffia australiana]
MAALAAIRWNSGPYFCQFGGNFIRSSKGRRRFSLKSMASSSLSPGSSESLQIGDGAQKITAPYGSWKSPISSDVVAGAEKRLGGMSVTGDGRLVWIESRPEESGRAVLVKEPQEPEGKPIDIIPRDFAARTLVHEYGGGAFAVDGNALIFSNYKDQRLYQHIIGGDKVPTPITPDFGGPVVRFADGMIDHRFKRYITVMEDHRQSSINATSSIIAIELDGENIVEPKVLVSGRDFYAAPRVDPAGKRMAWLEWEHPNMHWDKAELWVGYFSEDGKLVKRICISGENPALAESPAEPKWSPEGELFFITDISGGFWNIYKWNESENKVESLYPLNAEFTRPLWIFGINSYDFVDCLGGNQIVCSYRKNGQSFLGILDHSQTSFNVLDIPFTDIYNIVSGPNCLYLESASAVHPLSIVKVILTEELTEVASYSIIWSSSCDTNRFMPYFSSPEVIEFPTEIPGQTAFAFFYPPFNPKYQAHNDEKPPLLLKGHSGPTAEARGSLELYIQYWTSRGWAFVDVNYGGSTGYGREYRSRLLGQWGIVDVNDCCSCARFLADKGKVDGNRLCIMGKSAGGYTSLAALAFKDTFKAGASLYGVADLALLNEETHKFESRYTDNLIGSEQALYQRSPINFVDKFTCPVILFQGLEDKVVPPDQARKVYQALKEKGIPVALVEFEGEQHGFRKVENIKFALEQQMLFFARLVGNFEPADEISPIKMCHIRLINTWNAAKDA